jgi:hypothetical protein
MEGSTMKSIEAIRMWDVAGLNVGEGGQAGKPLVGHEVRRPLGVLGIPLNEFLADDGVVSHTGENIHGRSCLYVIGKEWKTSHSM